MYLQHPARIVDRFCGSGKTTELIASLSPNLRYLIIVPYLTEVDRIIKAASKNGIIIKEPSLDVNGMTKRSHLLELAHNGDNICTTHAMYPRLSEAAEKGLFKNYTVIIDEVVETVKPLSKAPSKGAWEEVYLGGGYVIVDSSTGQVTPTEKWHNSHEEISDALTLEIYKAAKAGTLYVHDHSTLVWALPKQILTAGLALIVYTVLSN